MRIFLIGLNEGFARSLARYLRGDPRLALVGVAHNVELGAIMLPATAPALVLVEWAALGAAPAESLQELRLCCPGLGIACVLDEAAYRTVVLQAGADAVISKSGFAEEFEVLLHGLMLRSDSRTALHTDAAGNCSRALAAALAQEGAEVLKEKR